MTARRREDLHAVGEPAEDVADVPDQTSAHGVLPAPPSPFAARQARRFVTDMCVRWHFPRSLLEAAVDIGNELVTNAVRHAASDLELHLESANGALLVAVHDYGPMFPASAWGRGGPVAIGEAGHRGLRLVRALAATVGSYPYPDGGKVVWATLEREQPDGGTSTSATRGLRRASDGPVSPVSQRRPLHVWGGGVSERIVVNGRRRTTARTLGGWRVEVILNWQPQDPDTVNVTVTSTPPHPALPYGCWQLHRSVLERGLTMPSEDAVVSVYPDPVRDVVLVELADDERPTTVWLPAVRVRRFLDDTAT